MVTLMVNPGRGTDCIDAPPCPGLVVPCRLRSNDRLLQASTRGMAVWTTRRLLQVTCGLCWDLSLLGLEWPGSWSMNHHWVRVSRGCGGPVWWYRINALLLKPFCIFWWGLLATALCGFVLSKVSLFIIVLSACWEAKHGETVPFGHIVGIVWYGSNSFCSRTTCSIYTTLWHSIVVHAGHPSPTHPLIWHRPSVHVPYQHPCVFPMTGPLGVKSEAENCRVADEVSWSHVSMAEIGVYPGN